MKLLIQTSVLFVITTLSTIDCRPVEIVAPVSTSLISASNLPNVYNLANSLSIYPYKLLSATSTILVSSTPSIESEPTEETVRDIIAPFLDAPAIEPIPSDDSDPIVEVPIKEPVTIPVENQDAYPKKLEHVLTSNQEELKNSSSNKEIEAIDKTNIGTCETMSEVKCEDFKSTDGFVCYNSSAGIACSTMDGEYCTDEAFDACYDFTMAAGMYCSPGGCAQRL